jgi:SAM-dependent methyltransferase
VGSYSRAAEFYDLLYASEKDYAAEGRLLEGLIREASPNARSVLDVACGTGGHARALLDLGFQVDGVDLEPQFVEIAKAKCPEGRFTLGEMSALELSRRYDVVTCLFSAIGYMETEAALRSAVRSMGSHLGPDGVLLVDPWFEPGQLTDGWISVLVGKSEDVTVCRMSRTVLTGNRSRIEFEYVIGRTTGLERRSEVHDLTLFTQGQMEAAFSDAGLRVQRIPEALRTRGIYIGRV